MITRWEPACGQREVIAQASDRRAAFIGLLVREAVFLLSGMDEDGVYVRTEQAMAWVEAGENGWDQQASSRSIVLRAV